MDRSRAQSRSQRGRRSLISLISRLPSWARDLYSGAPHRFREIRSGRELRLVLNALRDLIQILEAQLAEIEFRERANEGGSASSREQPV